MRRFAAEAWRRADAGDITDEELYEAGRLSGGAAAELAGLPKPVFLERLAAYGVPAFRQGRAELNEEAANA